MTLKGFVKVETVVTGLVCTLVSGVVTLGAKGWFSESSAPLEKRVYQLELNEARKSGIEEEILRRLGRIETKIDQGRK